MTSKVRLSVVLLKAVMREAFSIVTFAPTATVALGTAVHISPLSVAKRRYVYWLAARVSSTDPVTTVLSSPVVGVEGRACAAGARLSGRTGVTGAACALNSAEPAPAATA